VKPTRDDVRLVLDFEKPPFPVKLGSLD